MKTPAEIIKILRSIQDVRLGSDGEIEVLFDPPSTTFPDGWEPNAGFNYNSFTQELLLLIEAELKGELNSAESTEEDKYALKPASTCPFLTK